MDKIWCVSFLDPQLENGETCSTAKATREHYACVHAVVGGLKLADPSITTVSRGLTASQCMPADVFTTAAVPGRGAALDSCVASPNAAAARGDAAQASFDRKLSHYRDEISDLRTPKHSLSTSCLDCRRGDHTRPSREHCRTLQTLHPAGTASRCRRNSLQRRWIHEIQIALLRRRAAMTRAVLPNLSARAEWLLAGIIDRAFITGVTSPPSPLASQSFEALQPSSYYRPVLPSSKQSASVL